MSLFPRGIYGPESDSSFTNLFRLLDDYDNYNRAAQNQPGSGHQRRQLAGPSFTPKFDVRETEDAYELHGELPGIDREHINIEFTDSHSIVIRGRVERSYTSGTPPAALTSEAGIGGSITEKGGENASHKARVEDEEVEDAKEKGTELAKTGGKQKEKTPTAKYWVSERSIGEFSRTFSFPARVDQDAIAAHLNNGILHIKVPKSKKNETRRIAIN
ncbi:HSP20-like chaperone [Lasiosphaeria hispida]|uniref:HSP20-like chaperone n=1 Tax=Lasiosphaeria hispida TaxID=260671 RepID=A0AAJ0HUL1_9PEZI|nr:HSP20-like chaperone [Lasiosphaeria hispida]